MVAPRAHAQGSIPAHTGKPRDDLHGPRPVAVYPRPHGEAQEYEDEYNANGGLSPPTRGSRFPRIGPAPSTGSIPAHTGKPSPDTSSVESVEVYPRPHGEAGVDAAGVPLISGLSPPTRGSHDADRRCPVARGSIPAHTGKPRPPPRLPQQCRVYPRPHGEAVGGPALVGQVQGLSPPTRGSLADAATALAMTGSIPAHTGKPRGDAMSRRKGTVYPRPHGEASAGSLRPTRETGLSPPTRGSRGAARAHELCHGSIPAHTGKPARSRTLRGASRVYPRPHGEARLPLARRPRSPGLSPPTRGSLGQRVADL